MISNWIDAVVRRRHPSKSRAKVKAEVEARHDEIAHSIAQRFSRGNVNIKRGAFLTRDDLAARKKKKEKSRPR